MLKWLHKSVHKLKWQVCYFILHSVMQAGFKFHYNGSHWGAAVHGRNLSTMETTVKLCFQWRQNFMLSISGWLFPQQGLNCSTKLVTSLFLSLAGSKAGAKTVLLWKSCYECNIFKNWAISYQTDSYQTCLIDHWYLSIIYLILHFLPRVKS